MSNFLPPLSTLITVEHIPQNFGFLRDGINSIFSKLYFENLVVERSVYGEKVTYSLSIISPELAIEIPGTNGMALVLNLNIGDGESSAIPISFGYNWQILKYFNEFKLQNFSFTPRPYFDILLIITSTNNSGLLLNSIDLLFAVEDVDEGEEADPIQRFIDDFNTRKSPASPLVKSSDPDQEVVIEDLLLQLTTNGNEFDIVEVIFEDYLNVEDDFGDVISKIERLFNDFFGNFTIENLKELLIPQILSTLENLNLALEFPRTVLQPLDQDDKVIENENIKSLLIFNVGTLSFSSTSGFEFENLSNFDFTKSQIANTGLTLEFENLKLDLSRTTNIPEAAADGRPDDFVGVFVQDAKIGLPAFWQTDTARSTAELFGQNLLIGTGGISGTIGMRARNPLDPTPALLETKFGGNNGFGIALNSFDLTFQQNAIIGSNINGTLSIPGFKKDGSTEGAEIGVNVAIINNEFKVTATPLNAPLTIQIPNVMKYHIKSIAVGKKDDRYFLESSGEIELIINQGVIKDLLKDRIQVQKLVIWSDGQIEFAGGGAFNLKNPVTLEFKPVKVSVTAIHLGSFQRFHGGKQRKYKYIGFDGSLNINPGGVDAKGSGIKVYFSVDDDPLDVFIRVQSISIDLVLSGTDNPALKLKGLLAMSDPGGEEYTGAVAFELRRPEMSGSAAIRFNPKVPSFLIDIGIELSNPIRLGATGTGIYGFRALVGQRYVASKSAANVPDDGSWYQYYKNKVAPRNAEGIGVEKFEQKNGFSFGAGVSFATAFDKGKTLSSKVFFLLSLREGFLLQGQAALLKERIKLDDTNDPPFSLFLAITSKSVQATFGVDYRLPESSGFIVEANGKFDLAFFFKDSSAWYVNFGDDREPIRAKILTLFKAYAYLMISARGIRFGAGASWDFNKKLGPFGIRAYAYLDLGARISFKPLQVGGFIAIGGGLDLKIFFLRLSLSLSVGLAVDVPKPFIITGSLEVCVRVLRKNRCARIELTWIIDREQRRDPVFFLKGNETDAKAINMLTEEPFPVLAMAGGPPTSLPDLSDYIIPVDSFINIEFEKPVRHGSHPSMTRIGGNLVEGDYVEYVPPSRGKLQRIKHQYEVDKVEIFYWDPVSLSWQTYNIYQALTPWQQGGIVTADTTRLMFGYWQIDDPVKKNKLSIMARTPINWVRYGTGKNPLEDFGLDVKTFLCPQKQQIKLCADFENDPLGAVVRNRLITLENELKVNLLDRDGNILTVPNLFGFTKALSEGHEGKIEIFFPEPTALAEFKMTALTSDVKISYYKKRSIQAQDANNIPITEYALVKEDTITPELMVTEVKYENADVTIDKIVIEPGECPEGDDTLSCGTMLPEATLLLNTLNENAQNHTLTAGDPNGGNLLTLDTTLTQHLPPGYTNCKLDMNVVRIKRRRWSFIQQGPRNPEEPRRGIFRILEKESINPKDIEFVLPAFDPSNPLSEPGVVTDEFYNFLSANAPELTLSQKSVESFMIEGNDSVESIEFVENNAFNYVMPPNTGVSFNYNNILFFSNIRPDTENHQEGLNYSFLVTAHLNNGLTADLRGTTSCFPIVCCEGRTARYLDRICESIRRQKVTLTSQLQDIEYQISREQTLCDLLSATDTCKEEGQRHCYNVTQLITVRDRILAQIAQIDQYLDTYCVDHAHVICNGIFPVLPCGVMLFQVCWMKEIHYNYNSGLPDFDDLLNNTQAQVDAIEKAIQPIWRPNTKYAIRIGIADLVNGEDEGPAGLQYGINATTFTYLFETRGPVGHFHTHIDKYNDLPVNRKDEFKLADLRHYIDYAKSYPNADGSIVNAKPLYYNSPVLYLFFVVDYIHTMYGEFSAYQGLPAITPTENEFEVVVRDPALANDIVVPSNRKKFTTNDRPVVPRDIRTMINVFNASNPCISVSLLPPKGVHHESEMEVLEPLKMYMAIFRSKFKGVESEVHRYNFQTSRYSNFEEHINSHLLFDENGVFKKKAVFDIELPTIPAADVTAAMQIVNDTMAADDILFRNFAHPYDRLIDAVFKLESLEPAVTTEFNIIRDFTLDNPTSDYILGILIRSPEPFNDPKIPLATLKQSIQVLNADGTVNNNYNKIIFSKDARNAFITRSDMHILDRELTFKFSYLEYTKDGYVSAETVTTTIDVPSSLSQLVEEDCGRVEVELNQVLQAELVIDATEYHFFIEGPNGFNETYIRNSPDGILPLEEIAGLDYNRTYEVKIKNLVGTRLSSFGPTCTFETRKLNFNIQEIQPAYVYVDEPVTLTVRLEFITGALYTGYTGEVTLNASGNMTGQGVVTITEGIGTISVQNAVAENVMLSLADSGNTGYGVTDNMNIQFVEHANRFVIDPPAGTISPNTSHPFIVRAVGPAGITDPGYNGTITVNATGSVTGTGEFNVVNGVATALLRNTKSEIVTLSLVDSGSTGFDVNSTQVVKFVNPVVKYQIADPADAVAGSNVTVNIGAIAGAGPDPNFNINVTLVADGADSGGGVITITNGVGSAVITRATPGTVTLSLIDSEGTGLDVTSTQMVEFTEPPPP